MKIAWNWAEQSTCSRLQVGAVIADRRGVVRSSGYNGAPAGMLHCDHRDDQPCRLAMHAEANAIIWAARMGIAVEDLILYVTHEPCLECAKLIIQAGISQVRYARDYTRNSGQSLLIQAGILTVRSSE